MLLKEKTLQIFGYDADSLSKGSKKKVCLLCDYCGIEFDRINGKRFRAYEFVQKDCCPKCTNEKAKEVNMLKYGVTNHFARNDVREKITNTIISKYGVENVSQNENIKEKKKLTTQQNYGVDHPMQSSVIKKKNDQTVLDKYGVENVSQIKEVKEKVAQTNLDRFGVKSYLASNECREKLKQTMLENHQEIQTKKKQTSQKKYGVDNPLQNLEIYNKVKKTNLEKYGSTNPLGNPEIRAKARMTSIKNGHTKEYNGKSMTQLSEELGKAYTTFVRDVREYGFEFAISNQKKVNKLELIVKNILEKYNINFSEHKMINGRFTDFLIEEHKLIIECDGNFWHSTQVIEDRQYHSKKQKAYLEAGYKSLFFREDEIKDKTHIVESIILNHCHMNSRIYARKCDVRQIKKSQAKRFFNTNHLMGKGMGTPFGLFFEGELVSCLQIRRRTNNNYEISRFCNITNTSVVGGFSKLLKFIENNIKIDSLMTFIDLRYGNGFYLKDLGFEKGKTYLSFKWFGDGQIFNRMTFKGNSGYEKGLARIYDCGQAKWTKTYDLD